MRPKFNFYALLIEISLWATFAFEMNSVESDTLFKSSFKLSISRTSDGVTVFRYNVTETQFLSLYLIIL